MLGQQQAAENFSAGIGNPAEQKAGEPWGVLEVTPVLLDRPEEFFDADPEPPPMVLWFFEHYDRDRLLDFLASSGLSDHQRMLLTDTNRWLTEARGIAIQVPIEVLPELAPVARERIYRALAESPLNAPHRHPITWRSDGFDECFSGSGLRPETIKLVRRMTYTRDQILCFSDTPYCRRALPKGEATTLLKILSRVPTLLVNLRVTAASDTEALANYWGRYVGVRNLKPLLDSLARVPDGANISIAHFFPSLPRSLLYSYPDPTNAAAARPPDCFWSTLNFSNGPPDDRVADPEYLADFLQRNYHPVPQAEQFGDLILFYKRGSDFSELVHACVFIADDLVFTKNGKDVYQPWLLMRKSDLLAAYNPERSYGTSILRRNAR